jgi:hypothetical protein
MAGAGALPASAQRAIQAALADGSGSSIKKALEQALKRVQEAATKLENVEMPTLSTLPLLNDQTNGKVQHALAVVITDSDYKGVEEHMTVKQKAHFKSASGSGANYFHIIPVEQKLMMTNDEEMYTLAAALQVPSVLGESVNTTIVCPVTRAQTPEEHLERCKSLGAAAAAHAEVKSTIMDLCRTASVLSSLREPRGDNGDGPDISVKVNGKSIVGDVTLPSCVTEEVVKLAAVTRGYAAAVAAKKKDLKYRATATELGAELQTWAVESGGFMCQHLTDLTESIGGIVDHVMADNPPYPKNWSIPNFSVYCRQRIQIAMRSAKAKLASKAAAWHRTQAGETDVPQTDGGLGGSDV